MDYLDFNLEIEAGNGREYLVTVLSSPAGEARETMHFPFDELTLENQLLTLQNTLLRSVGKRRLILSPTELKVQNFGRALFNALFIGEVRSRYVVSQSEAAHQGKGLRLKLHFQSPEMAALPWEFLYDSNQVEYVCLSSNTPVVRYLELPNPPQPLTVIPPLRILGMTVSPKGLDDLDIEREKQRVEKATEYLQRKNLVEFTWLQGHTWQDLQRALRRGRPWHIFHFIGHGGFDINVDEGHIVLEDDEGKALYFRATSLGRLLIDHRSLRLIVLNSCEGARGSTHDIFSSTATILVRRGIPAVLAMQYEITDRAAIELSRAFYEALTDGLPVDAAVSEARKAISLSVENTLEWGTPVLFMRSPNGVLFAVDHGIGSSPQSTISAQQTQSLNPPSSSQQVLLQIEPQQQTMGALPVDPETERNAKSVQTPANDNPSYPSFQQTNSLAIQVREKCQQGDQLLKQQHYSQALHAYEEALSIEPQNFYAWNGKGTALYSQGNYKKAYDAYQRAIEIEPENPIVWVSAGLALKRLQRHQQALVHFERALNIDPKYIAAWIGKADTEMDMNQPEEAITSYEQALTYDQHSFQAWNGIGNARGYLRDYAGAVDAYSRALLINPRSCVCWCNKAEVLVRNGDNRAALEALNQATELDRNYTPAWRLKADVYEALGNHQEAQKARKRIKPWGLVN
jgi:tetratricopeptide (TPR) repeat protein